MCMTRSWVNDEVRTGKDQPDSEDWSLNSVKNFYFYFYFL